LPRTGLTSSPKSIQYRAVLDLTRIATTGSVCAPLAWDGEDDDAETYDEDNAPDTDDVDEDLDDDFFDDDDLDDDDEEPEEDLSAKMSSQL